MSNSQVQNELRERLNYHLKLFCYAQRRGLSFALFHYRKAVACIRALNLFTVPLNSLA